MYSNDEILAALAEEHGIVLSRRTLERTMQRKGLWRRKDKTDVAQVSAFIEAQLQNSGQCHGYRWMHQKCWMNGMVTDRETVRILMRLLDGEGVQLRTRRRLRRRIYHSRGPNYVWHIDGYDKLKPFGIAISGCIDGFSRRVIWLHAYKTNNDPDVIAGYFMDAVLSTEGCPERVRLDMGTENVRLAEMQNFLHWSEGQVANTDHVTFGPSTGNQRIERWWLTLRNQCAQFWMDIFDKLRCDGHFADTFLDKSLVQFCFLSIIQEELDTVAATWNEHRIRRVHASRSPHGRPSIMHLLPELYGARDCRHRPALDKIEACVEECVFKDFPCDEDVFHVCVDVMSEHNLSFTNEVFETVNLYIALREHILRELSNAN
uniref:Integrase core domain-containing protein n=1 Tax=Larimichthys crocea TaxID=215358 RepID=A0A0F8C524_LARCR